MYYLIGSGTAWADDEDDFPNSNTDVKEEELMGFSRSDVKQAGLWTETILTIGF